MRNKKVYILAMLAALVLCLPALAEEPLEFPRRNAVVKVVERVKDSVVNISTERVVRRTSPWDELFPFQDHDRTYKTNSLGSGVILDEDGYIITNAHVVQRATRIMVNLACGNEYEATVISVQPESDLALIKIECKQKLIPIEMTVSSDLMIGETAIAMGNPFGLSHTVTVGVISATDRSIHIRGKEVFKDFLQTDAAINPGNSGGPLMNINGKLIGINTAIHAGANGIGFAIPVDRVREALHDLISPGKLAEIYIGFKLEDAPGKGVSIAKVAGDGPADKAGLKKGDRLLSVEGEKIKTFLDVAKMVIDKNPGDKFALVVKRGDKEVKATLTLEAVPENDVQKETWKRLGMKVSRLPAYKAKKAGLDFQTYLVVEEVEKDGPADRIGIKKDDVLLHVRIIDESRRYRIVYYDKKLHDYPDLAEFLNRTPAEQSVTITVQRDFSELQGKIVLR